ncbi:YopX family protein [Sporosarcina sp. FSL K6-1508]|uniref:YopX family protein n=1 Tax=Sporosarcina sp. FSL K6-1508 TaxID=2921553 RepID=UPI0030F6C6AA
MREIKFRGKSTLEIDYLDMIGVVHANGWVFGNLITNEGKPYIVGDIEDVTDEYINPTSWISVHPKSIGQFTGLKDKGGKKIYEGHVLKRDFEIGNTIYHPVTLGAMDYEISDSGHFRGVVHYRPSEGFVLAKVQKYSDENELVEKKSAVKIYPRYAEIIGNQFENPELLEVAE